MDCAPVTGFTPTNAVLGPVWLEGLSRTRMVPSAIDGTTRSSRLSNCGRRVDRCAWLAEVRRAFGEVWNIALRLLFLLGGGLRYDEKAIARARRPSARARPRR